MTELSAQEIWGRGGGREYTPQKLFKFRFSKVTGNVFKITNTFKTTNTYAVCHFHYQYPDLPLPSPSTIQRYLGLVCDLPHNLKECWKKTLRDEFLYSSTTFCPVAELKKGKYDTQ